MKFTILVIDDEKNIRTGLQAALELDGYEVLLAEDGTTGLSLALNNEVDLVITDLRMPGVSGEEVLRRITTETPGIPVIVLTGHGTVENAVEAMRSGAYDFLTKPLNLDRLSLLVKRALQSRELVLQNRELEQEAEKRKSFEHIIGKSPSMLKLFDVVKRVAPTRASVLITGESGVGKELIANALHNLSTRKDNPIIKVHCAALAENILESELFGHEKGAFTGAVSRKRGRFELAHGGTIFLDEIGEINQSVQIKILRVLQEKMFERVGGEDTIEVDVRVITATNRDLEKEIAEGRFREDLFYRLNVVRIHVPPLRERKDDLPLMISAFVKEFAEENGKVIENIDPKARQALYAYDWPGNVRQLRNCIESAVVMTTGTVITLDELPPSIREMDEIPAITIPVGATMADAEREIILQTLAAQNGNKSKTAEVLGIGRKTLHRKLDEYGDEVPLQS
ncbi:MAG TPA: sigma-54 dependent transcriptional regulator [Treponemataceae bacterium]|nr:MAG: Transcriptional regulatory protein ZraR [Spirochaetes bacterium ADurb.Bin215]HPA10689.1 sigma-54 dependent transcriptional regulator [Treponemataceae bacterium]HPX14178.1 sigma-54 dependent transcriptional regulator [Treponemataceae bacterium]HQB88915.1 sigma-54 dependent transcriptional regulator [Treponemataceae bacterium]HRR03241.1 sigma-54 dependent transcriptional regulator [Treponemataceae bacterium]